jgi:hypothetical protein
VEAMNMRINSSPIRFQSAAQYEKFYQDVFELVGKKVRLVSDVLDDLRGGYKLPSGQRWRNINRGDFELFLKTEGYVLCSRQHGAGLAIYVSASAFSSVEDRFGKTVAVHGY